MRLVNRSIGYRTIRCKYSDSMRRGCCTLLLLLATAGCQNGHDATVNGTVRHAGAALGSGSVTFHPVVDGPLAIGDIAADGTYRAKTGNQEGLRSGEYRVSVVATRPMPEATANNPEPLPKLLTAARYGDPETSGLTVQIKPGSNSFDVELE